MHSEKNVNKTENKGQIEKRIQVFPHSSGCGQSSVG
jgi:hypothetical protein